MNKSIKSFLIVWLCLLSNWLLANDNSIESSNTPEPITIVASITNPPFSFSLPDGTKTGLYIDFWNLWAETNDIPIEIIMARLEKGLELVKNKQAIHAGLFYNKERAKWADFSVPIHQVDTGIIYSRSVQKPGKLKHNDDILIAAHPGSFQANYIKTKFPHLNLTTDVNNKYIFNQLLDDKVQALVAEIPFMKAQLASRGMTGVFKFSDEILMKNLVHAVIAKGQPELVEIINNGIENIPVKSLVELEKKWLPTLEPYFSKYEKLSYLTLREQNWLLKHPNLSLGADTEWYPFDFSNSKGEFSGIAADYIKYLSDNLNIKFDPIKGFTWGEFLNRIKQGKVDVMSAVAITEERKATLNYTNSYFKAPIVIVTNKNSFYADNMKSLYGKTLGIVKGYAMNDWIKRDYPQIIIKEVDSIADGLQKVNQGVNDAYLGAIAVVNNEIETKKLYNIQISAFAPYDFEIAMIVRDGLEPLIPIINKTIANMSENHRASIANNWLSVRVENGTKLSTILQIGLPILLFFIMIILIILRLNKKLKKEITSRIKVEKELKHLAQHDDLTGLANWRMLEEKIQNNSNQTHSIKKNQTILFVDIDGFKFVNDSYGHKIGDLLLISIADRLKGCFTDNQIIARFGGDEFIVCISQAISEDSIKSTAEKVLKTLKKPYDIDGLQINISASIGISISPDDGEDIEVLTQKADTAMYEAKKSGKNTYKFFKYIK